MAVLLLTPYSPSLCLLYAVRLKETSTQSTKIINPVHGVSTQPTHNQSSIDLTANLAYGKVENSALSNLTMSHNAAYGVLGLEKMIPALSIQTRNPAYGILDPDPVTTSSAGPDKPGSGSDNSSRPSRSLKKEETDLPFLQTIKGDTAVYSYATVHNGLEDNGEYY